MTSIEFENDRAEEAGDNAQVPMAALLRAARERPGEWAKVPEVVATSYLQTCRSWARYFDVPIEIRITTEGRWLRYGWSARGKTGARARGIRGAVRG
jgi:hypothetical protein